MSVQTRPVDLLTRVHGLLGTPFVEFAFALASGGYSSYREIGIVEAAEIQQAVAHADMRDPRSGTSQLVRRHTREFDLTLQATTKKFDGANMQLMLLSSDLRQIAAGVTSIADEAFQLTDDADDFVDLDNASLVEPLTAVSAAEIELERVGTGQGTPFGETQADFALDFTVLVFGDISSYIETTAAGVPTERVGDLVAGASPAAGKIGIIDTAIATSGEIIYPSGEGPAAGVTIDVTYEPSHTFTENVDYFVDPKSGRVRVLFSSNEARALQPMEVSYDFNAFAHEEIDPGTQLTFPGRARIRHLPDAGVNLIWPIPQVSIQASGDAFTFNPDEWAGQAIQITLENDGTSTPYGTCEIYDETLTEA
jgi:hypothetical protein